MANYDYDEIIEGVMAGIRAMHIENLRLRGALKQLLTNSDLSEHQLLIVTNALEPSVCSTCKGCGYIGPNDQAWAFGDLGGVPCPDCNSSVSQDSGSDGAGIKP